MQLHSLYKSVPPQWPMAGLSMLAASMAPDLKHAFLLHFWVRQICWSCVSHHTQFDARAVTSQSICPMIVDHLPHLQVSYLMGFGGGLVTSLLIMVSNTVKKTLYLNVVPHDRVLRHSIIHQTPGIIPQFIVLSLSTEINVAKQCFSWMYITHSVRLRYCDRFVSSLGLCQLGSLLDRLLQHMRRLNTFPPCAFPIQDPVKAPIAMLSSNTFGITFAVCW